MTTERNINLDYPPDGSQEVRLVKGNCVVSIWLPADMGTMGEALSALGEAGFKFAHQNGSTAPELQEPHQA